MIVSVRSLTGWALTLILPVLACIGLQPALTPASAMLMALMLGAAVQWGFRLVPDFVTGLMMLLLCVLFGLVPAPLAFSGFTSSVFFLVLGVFLLSALLTESALIPRLSYRLLRLSQVQPRNSIYAVLLTAVAMTLAMPSPLGRSAVLAPLLKPLASGCGSNFRTALVFAMAQGSTLWSTVFLTGNPLNFVLLGFLDSQTQQRFQWLYWFYATCAFALVAAIGMALLLAWMLRGQAACETPNEGKAETLPALSWRDAVVAGLYGVLFLAIFTRHLHHIELHWILIALALVGYYIVPMPLQAVRAKVDWPTLLFIASIVSWQPMLHHVGVDIWIAAHLPPLLKFVHHSLAINILYLAVIVGVVRLIVPGAPAFVILLTTLLPLSASLGMSGWILGFVLLTLSEGFILPHQHGVLSHLLSELQASHIEVDQKRLLLGNGAAWALRLLAILAGIPLWHYLSLI